MLILQPLNSFEVLFVRAQEKPVLQEPGQPRHPVQRSQVQEVQAARLLLQARRGKEDGDPEELQHKVADGKVHVRWLRVRGSGLLPHTQV